MLVANVAPRILVVDDFIDSADGLAVLLSLEGYNTRTAYSGYSALHQAVDFKPRAVLLDVWMPGMDGFETARRLRKLLGRRSLAVIAVSAVCPFSGDAAVQAQIFDAQIPKPVALHDLLELLTAAL